TTSTTTRASRTPPPSGGTARAPTLRATRRVVGACSKAASATWPASGPPSTSTTASGPTTPATADPRLATLGRSVGLAAEDAAAGADPGDLVVLPDELDTA